MPEGLRPPHSTVYINSMKRGFSPQAAGASSNFSYLRLPKMTQKKGPFLSKDGVVYSYKKPEMSRSQAFHRTIKHF